MNTTNITADPRTLAGLVDYLRERATEHDSRSETRPSHYGAGIDAGMAIAFKLAAEWIEEATR